MGSGLFDEWFETDEDIYFGPTLTPWGPVTVRIVRPAGERLLSVDAHWRGVPPRVDVEVPGFAALWMPIAARRFPCGATSCTDARRVSGVEASAESADCKTISTLCGPSPSEEPGEYEREES